MNKYSVNWEKTPAGNAIQEGETIQVTVNGSSHISGGVFLNNLPLIPGFAMGNTMRIKLARRGMKLEGMTLVLKTRAFYAGRIVGYDDSFIVM